MLMNYVICQNITLPETINDRSNGKALSFLKLRPTSQLPELREVVQPRKAKALISIYLGHEVSTVTSHTQTSIQTFGLPPYASHTPQALQHYFVFRQSLMK